MLTFPNVTSQVFALVLDQLRAEATVTERPRTPEDDQSWFIEGNGIRATVQLFDGLVSVDVFEKPWYVPDSLIAGKIRDAITLAQQAVAKAEQGGEVA